MFCRGLKELGLNVSKAQNHLLKSPFCVHPKTGRVCVPIDPLEADSFDPFAVPTVRQLNDELNKNAQVQGAAPSTSLAPYIQYFERDFLNGLRSTVNRERRTRADQRLEF